MCKHLTDFSDVTPNFHILIRGSALIAKLFFLILVTAVIANLAFLIHYDRETKSSVEKKEEKEQQGR
jgi:Tfp pilus assembly protein PilO